MRNTLYNIGMLCKVQSYKKFACSFIPGIKYRSGERLKWGKSRNIMHVLRLWCCLPGVLKFYHKMTKSYLSEIKNHITFGFR